MAEPADLAAAVEAGDRTAAKALISEALAEGVEARALLGAMTGAMEVIGGRFQRGEIYVPEMLISGRAMKEAWPSSSPCSLARGFGLSIAP